MDYLNAGLSELKNYYVYFEMHTAFFVVFMKAALSRESWVMWNFWVVGVICFFLKVVEEKTTE